jgi:hypothetical protein
MREIPSRIDVSTELLKQCRQSPRTKVRGLKGNPKAQIDQTKKGEI